MPGTYGSSTAPLNFQVGHGGTVIFFQNEMPYDPPSQAAWMEAPGVDGWAALKVADTVTAFSGYGIGSYSFFNQGVDIYAANAFEVPTTLPASSLHDLLTIFLDPTNGKGGLHSPWQRGMRSDARPAGSARR